MKDVKFQGQVVHCLLLKEVSQYRSTEIWFNVFGFLLKFPLGEFTVVTSLKYYGNFERTNIRKSMKNTLVDKYFDGSSKVKKNAIEDCFLSQKANYDEDIVKLVVLYFFSLFLFSSPKNKFINKDYLDITDDDLYNHCP